MYPDGEHRHTAISHDVLGDAAQKQMRQSRAAVGPHHDHLAVQLQCSIYDRRTWRSFTNQGFGIRRQFFQLVHVPMRLLAQHGKRITASRYRTYLRSLLSKLAS